MNETKTILPALAALAFTLPCTAQVWTEAGDAGDLLPTAQRPIGSGPLTRIQGSLSSSQSPNGDVDLYRITIIDEANFSATTNAATLGDLALRLFDASGQAVVYNDDIDSANRLSRITSQGVFRGGEYYLAVAYWRTAPLDSNDAPLFPLYSTSPAFPGPDSRQVMPNPGVGSLASWEIPLVTSSYYQIDLTGVAFPEDDLTEFEDAGRVPASAACAIGSGPIPAIHGELSAGGVDLYRIAITDFANFSASTVGGSTVDTQLFLFDQEGKAVVANDDYNGRQSRIASVGVFANGVYYLAISQHPMDPYDPFAVPMFSSTWYPGNEPAQLFPTSNASFLNDWNGTPSNAPGGAYTITFTGVERASGLPGLCDAVGVGCGTAILTRETRPVIGRSFDFSLRGVVPNALGAVLIDIGGLATGVTQPSPPFAANCVSHLTNPGLTLGISFTANTQFGIAVPNDRAIVGLPLALQGAEFDAASGLATLTNALRAQVGDC